jgi:dTMP kinase
MGVIGKLITFEGGEGSGKSTQIVKLADFLTEKGIDVVITKEPGGCHKLQQLRTVLLHQGDKKDKISELFLMLADRAQHCEEVIKPFLKQGKWVLCDRFIDSTTVYQGISLGCFDLIYLNKIATKGLVPDITFLLYLDYKIGLERVGKRGEKDRYEKESGVFHKRVQEDYFNLFTMTDRMIYIDASKSEEEIFKNILYRFENWYKNISYMF